MSARADFALALEECRQFRQGVAPAVLGVERQVGVAERHGRQILQLHVEVAHGAEQAGQPPELSAEDLGADGQHAFEQREGGAQTPRGHPHVVQLFGILAQPGARLLGAQDGQLAAQHREGHVPHGGRGRDLGRPELGRARDLLAQGQQACFELGEAGRLQPAGQAELLHDRLERLEPIGLDLDLDPAQLHGPLPVADHDHGVVERDLSHIGTTDPQREGTPPGADLQHLA